MPERTKRINGISLTDWKCPHCKTGVLCDETIKKPEDLDKYKCTDCGHIFYLRDIPVFDKTEQGLVDEEGFVHRIEYLDYDKFVEKSTEFFRVQKAFENMNKKDVDQKEMEPVCRLAW